MDPYNSRNEHENEGVLGLRLKITTEDGIEGRDGDAVGNKRPPGSARAPHKSSLETIVNVWKVYWSLSWFSTGYVH